MNHRIALGALALLAGLPCAAEDVLIRTRDATLSAIVERPDSDKPLPTVMIFDIYADPAQHAQEAQEIVARGFAAVVADARGKNRSPDAVAPYEKEAEDARAVIEWIAQQPWSNGKVGMIGGSYNGFTAWAAAKRQPRALKGIAVSAAAIPGQGLPMYNNVFLNANYQWAFYVTNNKLLDDVVNGDRQRWFRMERNWFQSGRPYREMDAVDGTPNPWLQRWLAHPDFDAYWQSMVPFGRDFARIDMPTLTITGYYDDAQISALEYFREHGGRRRNAEDYLVIGPYDHVGTHASKKPLTLRDYTIDPAAQFDTHALKLDFMDYVLRGGPKPAMLVDRVNFEVMGANEWRHSPSLAQIAPRPRRLWLSTGKGAATYAFAKDAPASGCVKHEVDLANRVIWHNYHSYPYPIIQGPLSYVTEVIYESEPFDSSTTITGSFTGTLRTRINKRDFDYGVTVFEAMPDGKLFHLGYSINRASYATDRTRRRLLTPGKLTDLPFTTLMVSRQLQKGSRLLVLFDVIKNPSGQVNYGTGRDVSDESTKDAGVPLLVEWCAGSFVDVPIVAGS